MHLNKYETTGFEELKFEGRFRFDETTDSVSWRHETCVYTLKFDDEEIFKQFCLQYQMYESQSALLTKSSSSVNLALSASASMSSSPALILRNSSSVMLFGSPRSLDSEAGSRTSSSVDSSPSILSQASLGSAPLRVPSLQENPVGSADSGCGSAPAAVPFAGSSISTTPSDSPVDGRSGSLIARAKSKQLFEGIEDKDDDEFDEPEVFKTKRRSNSNARGGSNIIRRPKRIRKPPTVPYNPDEDPYAAPIKTMRRLNGYRSPREKVECALKALNQTVQAITSFWKQNKKDIIVGADDLVPIFAYVVLRASVPAIYFEMNVRF